MNQVRKCAAAIVLLALGGCAAHSSLEPVGRGEREYHAGVGGPIVAAFGTHLPVPYAVAGLQYGLLERVNVGGEIHITPLFYEMFGAEAGLVYFQAIQKGWRPTLGLGGRLLALGSFKSDVSDLVRILPIASVTGAWSAGRNLAYIGGDVTWRMTEFDYDTESPGYIISPFAGWKRDIGSRLRVGLELKWQAANFRSDRTAVEYSKVGKRGALATFVTVELKR